MPTIMEPRNTAELDEKVCGSVWTSRVARDWMETLAYDIGPRPAALPAMCEASRAVTAWLQLMGANSVHTEAVPVFAWQHAPSTVELTAPRRRFYQSVQHVHSAAGCISAPLVDAGAGSEAELDRVDGIQGAIVLLTARPIAGGRFEPLQMNVERICSRGAAGLLVRSLVPGTGPAVELMGVDRDTPVPVLGVSWEDGGELGAVARDGRATVKIEASGKSFAGECVNTVAELGPAGKDDEIIILSAHIDSFEATPGCFDNLTGTVTLLEIARVLAPLQGRFLRRLRLLLYTGEEYGFLGSRSYVANHQAELGRVPFVFNMDSLWAATADQIAVMWAAGMRDYIDNAFRTTARTVDVRNMFCMSSDYLPYMLEGIACARPAGFEAPFPPYSHTSMDTPDKVPPDWISLNAMNHAMLLVRLLTDPRPLPTTRRTGEEVKALLERESATEPVRVYRFNV